MPSAFCPNCGTEVDDDARFCPACGTTLRENDELELPEAPAWPEVSDESAEPAAAEPEEKPGETPVAPDPVHAAPAGQPAADLPFTWPTTLSGWLIGGGATLGAVSLIASLSDAVSLLLMLALLGVAATVFVSDRLPQVPRLRLVTLSITMVGLGVALERAGFGARGADSVLLVAMIAAAGGALLVELDRDRPLNPPG